MKNVLKIDYYQTLNSLKGGGKFSLLKIAFSFVFLTVAISCAKENVQEDANEILDLSEETVSARTTNCRCFMQVTGVENGGITAIWSLDDLASGNQNFFIQGTDFLQTNPMPVHPLPSGFYELNGDEDSDGIHTFEFQYSGFQNNEDFTLNTLTNCFRSGPGGGLTLMTSTTLDFVFSEGAPHPSPQSNNIKFVTANFSCSEDATTILHSFEL